MNNAAATPSARQCKTRYQFVGGDCLDGDAQRRQSLFQAVDVAVTKASCINLNHQAFNAALRLRNGIGHRLHNLKDREVGPDNTAQTNCWHGCKSGLLSLVGLLDGGWKSHLVIDWQAQLHAHFPAFAEVALAQAPNDVGDGAVLEAVGLGKALERLPLLTQVVFDLVGGEVHFFGLRGLARPF